ncbi:hypothetical protein ACHAWF_004746 [Thalassiosira exigua]
MSLVKNNAEVGAEIATSIRDLSRSGAKKEFVQSTQMKVTPVRSKQFKPRVVCVGGTVSDSIAKTSDEMIIGTSNPGNVHCSDGGVGRNIAEVLGSLGSKPLFYTAIGSDDVGRRMVKRLEKECGVITTSESVHVAEAVNTAQYLALLDHKRDLIGGVADMEALSKIPVPSSAEELEGVEFLVLDANAPVEAMTMAAQAGSLAGSLVCFEPTSVPKAKLLSGSDCFVEHLSYIFPNEDELFAMAGARPDSEREHEASDEFECVKAAASKLLARMKPDTAAHVVITLGSRGVMLASKGDQFKHFPADAVSDIESSNGAGDTFCGAFIHSLLRGANEEEAVGFGMKAALLSLDCAEHAIARNISSLTIENNR